MKLSGGEFVKVFRERTGKNQREFGAEIGVSDQTVSNWETGVSKPKLNPPQMLKLCQLLNCSLEDLAEAFSSSDKSAA
ncbi:MAG: helix-turn-helix domain-containing protein [Stenomitos rutilans HA7619-LM2]|jgi:DNA-binding XRE family transcriptional regulator|nr:helix-turn-helix domain-containing protein [Stenomitos rutilans HA7619-LM2]MBW4469343.1 helix-turn-helix domain-containing protein [Stenomitos rutilans HA7619-LM2]